MTAADLADLAQDIRDRCGDADPGAILVAAALLILAQAQDRTASQLKWLGTGDAATTMGAIEALTVHLGEKIDLIVMAGLVPATHVFVRIQGVDARDNRGHNGA